MVSSRISRCQRAPSTVSGPRDAGSVRRTAPGVKRRSGSSVRTSTVTSPRTPWGRPMRPTTTVSGEGWCGAVKGGSSRSSATVGVDDVDPEAATADTGHDLAQRLGGAAATTDDLAQVVGVHPHLEGLAATTGQHVDLDLFGVVDDALDQVLECVFEHVLLGGGLGRSARGRALAAGAGGLGNGVGGRLGGLLRGLLGRLLLRGGRVGSGLGRSVGGRGLGGGGLLRRGLLLRGRGALGGLVATGGADGLLVEGLLVRLRGGDLHGRRRGLALELLPVTGHPEDGGHGLGRLRADGQPVLGALGVDLDEGGVLLRVVLADGLDDATLALGAGVGDDDAVVRRAHLAQAHELDLGGHGGWSTPRTSIVVLAGATRGGTPGRSEGHVRARREGRTRRVRPTIVPDAARAFWGSRRQRARPRGFRRGARAAT